MWEILATILDMKSNSPKFDEKSLEYIKSQTNLVSGSGINSKDYEEVFKSTLKMSGIEIWWILQEHYLRQDDSIDSSPVETPFIRTNSTNHPTLDEVNSSKENLPDPKNSLSDWVSEWILKPIYNIKDAVPWSEASMKKGQWIVDGEAGWKWIKKQSNGATSLCLTVEEEESSSSSCDFRWADDLKKDMTEYFVGVTPNLKQPELYQPSIKEENMIRFEMLEKTLVLGCPVTIEYNEAYKPTLQLLGIEPEPQFDDE